MAAVTNRIVAAALAGAALLGCYAPVRVPAAERALAIYDRTHARPTPRPADGPVPATLSLDEAVVRARQRSPRLAVANAKVKTAEALTAEAGALKNPQVRLQNMRLDDLVDGAPRARAALRLFPPRPGENEALAASARAEEAAARAEARAEEMAEEAETRWLFQEVLLHDEELAVASEAARSRRALADVVHARASSALATRVDEAYADLAAQEAEAELRAVKVGRDAAFAGLMERVGLPPEASVRLVGDALDPAALPPLPEESMLIAAALRNRPEISVVAARVDAADASAYVERAQRWPWFTYLEMGYDFSPTVPTGLGFRFAGAVEVPVFDTHSNGVARAEAERAEASVRMDAKVEAIAREVRERLREARAARELLRLFHETEEPALAAAEGAAKEALAAAQIDLVRMHLVEERRSAAAMQKLRLVRRYRLAVATLGAAVGAAPSSVR